MGEKFFAHTSSGAYFVTIVTHGRQCLFGKIVDGEMRLNECGEITKQFWMEIPKHYPHVSLDEFVIMPNHVHGIIVLNDSNVGANNHSPFVGAKNFSPLHCPQYNAVSNHNIIPYKTQPTQQP